MSTVRHILRKVFSKYLFISLNSILRIHFIYFYFYLMNLITVEDPDMETMKRELKDAFRLFLSRNSWPFVAENSLLFRIYDKEGMGYITNETLRSLIGELLAPLTDEELDGIIDELDEDGSGTMDFDEFCEMMMSQPEN